MADNGGTARKYDLPRSQKLKSRVTIQQLFEAGKSIASFPIRVVWTSMSMPPTAVVAARVQVAVSVPTRYFKRANQRNRIKRQLRECYRLHKYVLLDALPPAAPHIALMLIFTAKTEQPYKLLERKTVELLTKLSQHYPAQT